MRLLPVVGIALLLAAGLARRLPGQESAPAAQRPAEPPDSLTLWVPLGLHPVPMKDGDSVLVDAYRSLLPVGDTVHPRKWALHGSSWLLAQAKHRGFRFTAVLFLWTQPSDSLLNKPPIASWAMQFARDSLGCWFIVNDTTPVSSCLARDDPHSPVLETQGRP